MANEWWLISRLKKKEDEKHEQIRDVRVSSIFSDDDGFTVPDGVPIVSMNDEEDDFDDTI